MNTSFISIVTLLGVASTVGGLIYVGRKLQVLDDLKETVDKIKLNLKVVSDFLTKDNAEFDPSELQSYSPYQLTPKGQELVKSLGFDSVFDKHQDEFFKFITSEEPKLKYDVELSAIKSIAALSDKEYMSFLKIYLYNNPSRSIENIAPTLGVYVRDKYLATHPEIKE